MVKIITKDILFEIDIPQPPELDKLASHLVSEPFHLPPPIHLKNPAPYFLYSEEKVVHKSNNTEWRETKVLMQQASDFGSGVLHYSIERSLLNFFGSQQLDDNSKGKILLKFCEIEFVLDILVLYELGVYRDRCTYKQVKKGLIDKNGGVFSSFENKKNYLKSLQIISNECYEALSECQHIRNHIAHNFFLKPGVGLSDNVVQNYSSLLQAIELIYNYAWLLLVQNYNTIQVDVLRWVVKNGTDNGKKS